MIKYEYVYDKNLLVTSRSVMTDYPDVGVLDNLFNQDRDGAKVLNILKTIYEGIAEEPLVAIEEDWWSKQLAIQEAEVEIKKVDDDVTQLANISIDQMAKDNIITELTTILGQYDDKTLTADVVSYKVDKQKIIDDLVIERNNIENGYTDMTGTVVKPSEWLKPYRGVTTTVTRPTVTTAIPKDVRKRLIAHERNRTVRSLEDTVADLAKCNTLLLSMVSSIYGTLSTTAKAKIPASKKAVIDYAVANWSTTSTRGDRQLKTEGTALIDKLYSREVAIADIVDVFK